MRRSEPATALPAFFVLSFVSVFLAVATTPEGSSVSEQPAGPPSAEIRGTVLDSQGEPVAGATVRVRRVGTAADRSAPDEGEDHADSWRTSVVQTTEEGTFHLRRLRGRGFVIRVEADGMAPVFEPKVDPGAVLKIRLEPGVALSGSVIDRQSGDPLESATVRACDESALKFEREACRRISTDDEGAFRLPGLARGKHQVEAVAQAHSLTRLREIDLPQALDPETEKPRRIELFLGPGARVAGEVLAQDDEPVAGALVWLAPTAGGARGGERLPARTDDDGRFDFPGAPVGRYDLGVRAEGLPRPKALPVEVAAGRDRTDLVVRFSAGASLRLRLVDSDLEPLSGLEFQVGATQVDAGRAVVGVDSTQIEAAADGRYTIRGVPSGTYELRFDVPGWRDVHRKDVKLHEDETTDLGTLVLDEGGSIAGLVTDDAGDPVADAFVRGEWRGSSFRSFGKHTRSDGDGRYRLSGLNDEGLLESVQVQALGYAPASKRSVAVGDEAVDFSLQRTAGVQGLVRMPDGQPATVFRIEARSESGATGIQDSELMARRLAGVPDSSRRFTDPEGKFTLEALPPGSYVLTAKAPGVAPAHRSGVTTIAGEITDIGTLMLREGHRVPGRVLSVEDGSPVPGVVIEVVSPRLSGFGVPVSPLATTRSDTEGRFVLEGLDSGAFKAITEHPDFPPAEVSFRLDEAGEPPELVVKLGRGGTIRGTVRDREGRPVAGARLVLGEGLIVQQSTSATTDSEGEYAFRKLRPGDYVVALLSGAAAADLRTRQATVMAHKTTVVDFGEDSPIRLRGRLVRQGETLGGRLLLFTLDADTKTARTDSDGMFDVGLDQAGTYQLFVSTGGGPTSSEGKTVLLVVPDKSEVYRDIEIEGASIRGRVVDEENRPVVGSVVTALQTGGSPNATGRTEARTDTEGLYALIGLEPGTYRMTVHAPDYSVAERHPVVVDEGVDLSEAFTLERGRVLRGRVVDPGGQGLAGAWVFAVRPGSREIDPGSQVASDASGRFEIPVREGAVDLHVFARGWAAGSAAGVEPSIDPDEMAVVIALTPGGSLRIHVEDPAGAPIRDARVSLRPLDPVPGTLLALTLDPPRPTDAAGETRAAALRQGPYEVALVGHLDLPPKRVEIVEGSDTSVRLILPDRR